MIKRDIAIIKCQLTPLTPIHIGSGEELSSCDYVIKDNYFFRISLEEFFEKLNSKKKEEFLKLIEKDRFIEIRKFVKDNYNENFGYVYKASISQNIGTKYDNKIGGAINNNENNLLSIYEFIGNYQGKYIPGSSLKGYIRTAYIANEYKDKILNYNIARKSDSKTAPFITPFISGKKESEMDKEICAEALGLNFLEPKFDPFKNITITDSNILNSAITIGNFQRANTKKADAPLPMGMHEVTKSLFITGDNIVFNFNLIIKNFPCTLDKKFKELSTNKDGSMAIKELKEFYIDTSIFEPLREISKKVLEDDILFFKKSNNYRCLKACEKIKEYSKTLKENEVLIKIGKGSGFNSKTLNLFNKKQKDIHTRVVVDDYPVGWGVLSYIEE